MPKTAHQLVARCFERDAGHEKESEKLLLKEHKLVNGKLGDSGRSSSTAEALAAEAYAGGHG